FVSGSKSAVVATSSGAREMYTEESAEVWFTDYGFGKTAKGESWVGLDPIFAETVNLDEYHVFVQPYGPAQLYVSERTPKGFRVKSADGSAVEQFSYRIVGKRLGHESKRL